MIRGVETQLKVRLLWLAWEEASQQGRFGLRLFLELNSIQGWPNFFLGGPSGKASPKTVRLGRLDHYSINLRWKKTHASFFPWTAGAGVLHPPVCGEWPGLCEVVSSHHLGSPWFPAAHQN